MHSQKHIYNTRFKFSISIKAVHQKKKTFYYEKKIVF